MQFFLSENSLLRRQQQKGGKWWHNFFSYPFHPKNNLTLSLKKCHQEVRIHSKKHSGRQINYATTVGSDEHLEYTLLRHSRTFSRTLFRVLFSHHTRLKYSHTSTSADLSINQPLNLSFSILHSLITRTQCDLIEQNFIILAKWQ